MDIGQAVNSIVHSCLLCVKRKFITSTMVEGEIITEGHLINEKCGLISWFCGERRVRKWFVVFGDG